MGGCSPGMRACAAACGHRQFVDAYRQERQRQEIAAENATLGYASEMVDYVRDNPLITFKQTLVQTKQVHVSTNHQYDRTEAMSPAWHAVADADAARAMQASSFQQANEASLLSIALNTDEGVEILRSLDPGEFRAHPAHPNVARAILDQADVNLPHDAASVTDVLRSRSELPLEWDPRVPLRTVDPTRYGLGAWQSSAPPAASAGWFASEVRYASQQRYLVDVCTRGAERARGAIENESGFVSTSHLGEAQLSIAQELVNMPRTLGRDGKPLSAESRTSTAAVDTNVPAIRTATLQREQRDLRLPKPPVLSPTAQAVLSRRSA